MQKNIYIIALLFFFLKVEAKKEEYSVKNWKPIEIIERPSAKAFDPVSYYVDGRKITPVSSLFSIKSQGVNFSLFTNPLLLASKMANQNYIVKIEISATYRVNDPSPNTVNFSLEIEYNKNGDIEYKSKDEYFIEGTGYCEYKITSVSITDPTDPNTTNQITPLNDNEWFTLRTIYQIERYYKPDPNFVQPRFISYSSTLGGGVFQIPIRTIWYSTTSNKGYITVNWNSVPWAEYYELEYCYADNYGDNGTTIPINTLKVNFKSNSTRIQTNKSSFTIPNIFEHGYLFCRVRPVGLWGKNFDQPIPGQWTLNDQLDFRYGILISPAFPYATDYLYEISPALTHELDTKNWQLISTFTEDAKTKSVISYLDGTLRIRQSQTNLSTNNTVVVGETIYDYQGRPAIDFLPVPTYGIGSETPAIKYQNKFNVNSSDESYSKADFDIDNPPNCDIAPNPASNSKGAANYYSATNTQKNGLQAYVPDADGYPFTQREYTSDLTGRIRRIGSPGAEHHLSGNNDKHETKIDYSTPTQYELDRLFGNDVGFSVYYKKEMMVDGNGQTTITYKDNKDKIIATALGGVTPSSLNPLNSQIASPTIVNLADPSNYQYEIVDNSLKATSDLVFSVPTTLNLIYNIDDVNLDVETCLNRPNVCYNCNYDLKVSIIDNLCGTVIDNITHNIGSIADLMNCSFNNSFSFSRSYQIPPGSYTVSKTLSVNQEAIDSVVNNFTRNICIEDKIRIITDTEHTDPIDACKTNCVVCESELLDKTVQINGQEETVKIQEFKLDGTCSTICNPQTQLANNSCLIGYERLLNDLTPPNGQYAKLDLDNPDPLSYFTNGNQLGIDWTTFWPDIEDSEALSTYLQSNPSEVKKLIRYHPEYCYYLFCSGFNAIVSYQENLSVMPLSIALEAANYGSNSLRNNDYTDDLLLKDPILRILNADEVLNLKDKLGAVSQALIDPSCPAVSNYNLIQTSQINASGLQNSTDIIIRNYLNSHRFLNTGASEEEWNQYKNLYIQIRQKYYETKRDEIINSFGSDCASSVDIHNKIANPEEPIWKNKIPVFPNKKQVRNVIENRFAQEGVSMPSSVCTPPILNPETTQSGCGQNCSTAEYLLTFLNQLNRNRGILENRELSGSILNYINFNGSWNNSIANGRINYGTRWQTDKLLIEIKSNSNDCLIELNTKGLRQDIFKNIYSFYCIKDTIINNLPAGISPQNAFVIRAILTTGQIVVMTGYSTCFRIFGCKPPENKSESKCNNLGLIDEAIKMTNDVVFKRNKIFFDITVGLNQVPLFKSEFQGSTLIYATEKKVGASNYFSFYNKKNMLDSLLFMYATIKYDDFKVGIKSYDGYEIGYEKDTCTSISLTLTYTTVQNVKVKVLLRLEKKTNLYFVECCKSIDDYKFCCIPPLIVPPGTFNPPLACDKLIAGTDIWNVTVLTDQYIKRLSDSIRAVYTKRCLQMAQATESLRINYSEIIHHFTLYYYDQASNLIATVPPKGVVPLTEAEITKVANYRNSGTDSPVYPYLTSHSLKSTYTYNSLNAVLNSSNPDGGSTNFCYDELGRIILSRDAHQTLKRRVSFSKYDPLGRVVKSGTIRWNNPVGYPLPSKMNYSSFERYLNRTDVTNSQEEITENIYTVIPPISAIFFASRFSGGKQQNTYNRISATAYSKKYVQNGAYDHAFYYSYDVHGNVKELLQDSRFLDKKLTWLSQSEKLFHCLKMMQYRYDLVSGKVNEMVYQPNRSDQFIHRYSYDADNRITKVQTFTKPWEDETLKDVDARYFYYDHGPLSRVELGHEQVQGLDYYYNIMGWLKGVNSPSLSPDNDPSHDGKPEKKVAGDVMSFALGYYVNDYRSIGTTTALPIERGNIGNSLFNGNIRNMYTSIGTNNNAFAPLQLRAFGYDALNRIVSSTVHNIPNLSSVSPSPLNNYKEIFSYDANGNIFTINRNGATNSSLDELRYNYQINTNKLSQVVDNVGRTDPALKDLDANSTFLYDLKGRLIQSEESGRSGTDKINAILWSSNDKVWEIQKNANQTLRYTYNALSQRVFKENSQSNLSQYYVRDLQGNTIAAYDIDTVAMKISWAEAHIYGSSRLGMWKPNIIVPIVNTDETIVAFRNSFKRGQKIYELSNHLGNVLVTINDRKIVHNTTSGMPLLKPIVLSANDYYAFGSPMQNRIFDSEKYKFGYGGQEKDNEIKGDGNSIAWEERIYDSRLGIWLSLDDAAKIYPSHTPYGFTLQNPIAHKEVDGDVIETGWDVFNVVTGVASLGANIATGNVGGALLDVGGLIYDVGATIVPGLPAGASAAIKAARATKAVVKVVNATENVLKVGNRLFQSASKMAQYTKVLERFKGSAKLADAFWDAGKGGANKLATALGTAGTGNRAHHIIPTELLEKSPLVQKAINEGFDFNGVVNGVALDVTRHPGGHPNYTQWVGDLISKASSNKANAGKSATEILTGVAETVKKTISSTKGKIDDLGK